MSLEEADASVPSGHEGHVASAKSALDAPGNGGFVRVTNQYAAKTDVVNFAESALRPMPEVDEEAEKKLKARLHPMPPRWVARAAQLPGAPLPGVEEPAAPAPAVPAPPLAANFVALVDNGSGIAPPDTNGAAGPTQLFVALNTQLVVQSKTGANIGAASTMAQFFSSVLVSGEQTSDPHVVYDPIGQRWIFVAISYNGATAGSGNILLAVSRTTDATGLWNIFKVPVDPGTSTTLGDYPIVGFNKDWITVSLNDFNGTSNAFIGAKVFVFDKAAAYANTGNGKHTTFTKSGTAPDDDFAICGAWTYDASATSLYMIEDYDGTAKALRLFSITGAVGSEALNRLTDVTPAALTAWDDSPPAATNGNFVPQQGSTTAIGANDARIYEAVYRNGTLWFANAAFLPTGAPTHVAAQWFQVNPATSAVVQAGRIEDPTASQTAGTHYFFPSITPNKNNDAFIGFSRGGTGQFVGTGYSMRFSWDPASTMRDPAVMHAGSASYNVTGFGNNRNRWGDYSITSIDPADDTTMWTIQEYANATNRFGTWWGKLTVDCAGKANGTQCDDGNLCTQGPKTCQAGVCVGGAAVVCSNGGVCSIPGTCQPSTGLCSAPTPAANGTVCSDGNLCMTSETCQNGACTGTPVVCNNGGLCTNAGTCVPATGQCSAPTPKTNGTACNDGNLCTPGETCTSGTCGGGTPVVCTAQDECHVIGSCQQASGACTNPAKADGTPCSIGSCKTGVCTPPTPPDAGVDAGVDSGTVVDSGVDSGTVVDSGVDSGTVDDSGVDSGTVDDSGVDSGAVVGVDSGTTEDSGVDNDSGSPLDAGKPRDAGRDAGPGDSGSTADASDGGGSGDNGGCGCRTAPPKGNSTLAFAGVLGLLGAARMRRRRRQ